MKKIFFLLAGSIAIFSNAYAAPGANLNVTITGPANSQVNTAHNYVVGINNSGPNTSGSISLVVDLPLTNTSPQVYVLGNVTENDTRCSIANNKLQCNLSALKKSKNTSVTFTYTAPVANKPLAMKAVVNTSNELDTQDNEFVFTPNIVYPDRIISSGTANNSHCTGRNLTAYFECLLFPSSISGHTVTLNSDHTITFSEPGYTGTWSQSTNNQLKMEYFDSGNKVMEFNGYSVNNGNCFEGITNFFPTSEYSSAYRVCL